MLLNSNFKKQVDSDCTFMDKKTAETNLWRKLAFITVAGVMLTALSCVSYLDSVVPKIEIIVTSSDQMNMNKNVGMGGYARTFWAATTRYETKGYELEKIQLESYGNGSVGGYLPIKPGSKSVNIIVWDDELTQATPYGGSRYAPYSRNHKLLETKGYFTPCTGAIDSTNKRLANWAYADSRLPAFGGGGTNTYFGTGTSVFNAGGPSEEVYTTVSNVSPDSSNTVDYTTFTLPTANHCNCMKPLQIVSAQYGFSSPKIVSDWAITPGNYAYHFSGGSTSWWFSQTIFRAPVSPVSAIPLTDKSSTTTGNACIDRIK